MSNATKEPSNRFWWMVIVSCVLPYADRFLGEDLLLHSLVLLTYMIFVVVVVRREFLENRLGSFFGYKPKSAENSSPDSSNVPSD